MSRLFYHVMQDNVGNLLFDVSGTMRLAGSATLATIYGDEALTVILPNPMTNHPSFGSFKCFLGAGDYDFHMAKAGYTFETLTGVQGHGTMAQQNADNVAITGGDASFGHLGVGWAAEPPYAIRTGSGTVLLGAAVHVVGTMGLGLVPIASRLALTYDRSVAHGISIRPSADTGAGNALYFVNAAESTVVGTITTTSTTTAYNTTSDGRLKEHVTPLTGGLEVLRALRPVAFTWKGDGAPGEGFIAQEVQPLVPAAVTGTPEAATPMGMDFGKLVPHLVSAVQVLAQQVEALTARLDAALETSLPA